MKFLPILLLWASFSAVMTAEGKIDFNRDIRPILAGKCYACHGPDKETRKAKLRLDDRASALKKEAFVPGKPDESELVYRIFTKDEDEVMPPPESKDSLTVDQKEILQLTRHDIQV